MVLIAKYVLQFLDKTHCTPSVQKKQDLSYLSLSTEIVLWQKGDPITLQNYPTIVSSWIGSISNTQTFALDVSALISKLKRLDRINPHWHQTVAVVPVSQSRPGGTGSLGRGVQGCNVPHPLVCKIITLPLPPISKLKRLDRINPHWHQTVAVVPVSQ